MNDMRVVINQYLPIRDIVFNSLRDAILTGKLEPGERLMEKRLADQIGVSRTPIRESMRLLAQEGLIEITPRKGAVVAAINEKDIHEVLEVRAALEALGVQLACANMTNERFEDIKKAAEKFDEIHMENNISLLAEKDTEFHDLIYAAANNEKLVSIVNDLRGYVYRFRIEYLKNKSYRKTIVSEHEAVLRAIKSRNIGEARELAIKHIQNQEKIVVELVRAKNETER